MYHATRVYEDILQTLPNPDNPTLMVRVNRMNPCPDFLLYAKHEWVNPFGSVKDRASAYLIRDLEPQGAVTALRGVVEPTSGNTGISLAAICAALGYRMRAVVPNRVPLEKKVLLRIAGAELDVVNDDVCPSSGMGEGSILVHHAEPGPLTRLNQLLQSGGRPVGILGYCTVHGETRCSARPLQECAPGRRGSYGTSRPSPRRRPPPGPGQPGQPPREDVRHGISRPAAARSGPTCHVSAKTYASVFCACCSR